MWFKGAVRGDEWVMCELCCGREVEKQPPNWESNHFDKQVPGFHNELIIVVNKYPLLINIKAIEATTIL